MKTPSSLFLALLLTSLALPAQKMGSRNTDAPTCACSVAFKSGASIKLDYQANEWGQGRTFTQVADKEKGAKARQMINNAPALGNLETSADITIGDKAVVAGKYAMRFTVDDDGGWHLTLAPEKGDKIDLPLKLADSQTDHQYVSIQIVPTNKKDGATMSLAFGKKTCELAIGKGGAKADPKDAAGEPKKGDK